MKNQKLNKDHVNSNERVARRQSIVESLMDYSGMDLIAASQMASDQEEAEFNNENKKESETMKNQKTDKIVMNKRSYKIYWVLLHDVLEREQTDVPPTSKKECKTQCIKMANHYKDCRIGDSPSIPELKRKAIDYALIDEDGIGRCPSSMIAAAGLDENFNRDQRVAVIEEDDKLVSLVEDGVEILKSEDEIEVGAYPLGVTKDEFDEYLTVQKSGAYNMFDAQAREMTDLTKDQWIYIMENYQILEETYSKADKPEMITTPGSIELPPTIAVEDIGKNHECRKPAVATSEMVEVPLTQEVPWERDQCQSCGESVEDLNNSHCDSCNAEYEKREDEETAKEQKEDEEPTEEDHKEYQEKYDIADDGSIKETHYILEGILFPRLNKNDSLEAYIDQVPHSCSSYSVLVEREVQLNISGWANFIVKDLLTDRPSLYNGVGGFFDERTRKVTKVTNSVTGQVVFVDTQGYKYARYVGMYNGECKDLNKPKLSAEDNVEDIQERIDCFMDNKEYKSALDEAVYDLSDSLCKEGFDKNDVFVYLTNLVDKSMAK